MNTQSTLNKINAALLALAFGTLHAVATDGTWNLNGNGNWSTESNWVGDQIADGVGATATFTIGESGNRTYTIDDTSRTLGTLIWGQNRSIHIASSGGAVLVLDNNGSPSQVTLTTAAGNSLYVDASIQLNGSLNITNQKNADSAKHIDFQSTGGTLTNISSGPVTITNNGGGTVNFWGTIADGPNGSVSIVQQAGSGIYALTLAGSNSYTGTTTVSAGALKLSGAFTNNIASSPTINVAGGALLDVSGLTGGTLVLAAGQSLQGSGTVTGSLNGGTNGIVAPGAATGLLTVSGGANLATGSLAIAIDDTQSPQCGKLGVSGTLDISNATLNLTVTGAPTQAAYVIASYGTLNPSGGPFPAVNNLPTGYVLDYAYGGNQIAIKQSAITWTVTFQTNGGSAVPSQAVPSGSTATQPADPTQTGLVFGGWYGDAGLTTPFNFAAPITAATTVFAKWKTFYQNWANGAAFTADANHDGVSNGVAWLLGAPPLPSSYNANGLLPKPAYEGGLVLVFDCLSAASRGAAVLKVQYSKDLGITDLWTGHEAAVPGIVTDTTVNNVHFVTTANGALIHIVATIPASQASIGGKLFGRLIATEN